jgi:hypothetical protein
VISDVLTVGAGDILIGEKVRPGFVARLAALHADVAVEMRDVELSELLETLESHDREFLRQRSAVDLLLHRRIGGLEDRVFRNRVLQARRELLSGKALTTDRLTVILHAVPSAEQSAISDLVRVTEARRETERRLRERYSSAATHARARVCQFLSDPSFQKGILISSPALFANIGRYVRAAKGPLTSRDAQIERGILRYLTRTAMKATPFATFCSVVAGELTDRDTEGARLQIVGSPDSRRTVARLNKRIYEVFWRHIRSIAALRRALILDLNPTLHLRDDRWIFLTASDVGEAFRRLERNDALDAVIASTTSGARYEDLITSLVNSSIIETDDREAARYVDSLLSLGLLRVRAAISEQSVDWDLELVAFLQSVQGNDAADAIIVALRTLRRLGDSFVNADAPARAQLLVETKGLLTETCIQLGIPGTALTSQPPFFEDMTADCSLSICRDDDVAGALNVLEDYIAQTAVAGSTRASQASMRHFYHTHYGEGVAEIPLLRFYEDYFREHYKTHLHRVEQVTRHAGRTASGYNLHNPFELPLVSQIFRAQRNVTEELRVRWAANPTAETIDLSRDALHACLGSLPPLTGCRSFGAFCQVALSSTTDMPSLIVMPRGYSVGYGKYFSRFMHLLPSDFQSTVVSDNASLSADRLAEIGGDASFNGNLHPPLLPFELAYPTGDTKPDESTLNTTDIVVTPDPQDQHRLLLIHRSSGKRVIPVDLGFLSMRMRPPLYRMLADFVPAGSHFTAIPEFPEKIALGAQTAATLLESSETVKPAAFDAVKASLERQIVYRPRITFASRLVLARRQWRVPHERFPKPTGADDAEAYFISVNRWRAEQGIPEEVYVSVVPEPPSRRQQLEPHDQEPGSSGKPSAKSTKPSAIGVGERRSKDWSKPQYIDFRNPLLVELFSRLTGSLSNFVVVLKERFPTNEMLPSFAGKRYTFEMILQVDSPGSAVSLPEQSLGIVTASLSSAEHD